MGITPRERWDFHPIQMRGPFCYAMCRKEQKEGAMEGLSLVLGMVLRLALPLGLLFLLSARLQAWDQRRSV
jgi:hypothetical protein